MVTGNHYSEGLKERKDNELGGILEGLVDRHGLENVVELLGEVGDGKSYQTATVWKDRKETAFWSGEACKL